MVATNRKRRQRYFGILAKWVALGAAVGLTAGCAENDGNTGQSLQQKLSGAITLAPFATCEDLESHVKSEAKQLISWQGSVSMRGGFDDFGVDMAAGGDAPAEPSAPTGEQSGAPSNDNSGGGNGGEESGGKNVVGTNNQEADVDEADIVKTDGAYVYVVRPSTLLIADAWPAEDAHVVSSTPIRGYPQQMFVADDIAVVFSTLSAWQGDSGLGLFDSYPEDVPAWLSRDITVVTVLDISDRANPTVVRESLAQGGYVDARLVGTTARVVVRTDLSMSYGYGYGHGSPGIPVDVGVAEPAQTPGEFAPSDDAGSPDAGSSDGNKSDSIYIGDSEDDYEAKYQAELAAWKAEMEAAIDASPIEALLPMRWELTNPGSAEPQFESALLTECPQVFKQSVSGGLGYLNVLSIDLTNPSETVPAVALLGTGHLVYASADSLYVASDVWDNWLVMMPEAADEEDWQYTAVHRFDIGANGASAQYAASGKVPGTILDSFSLSEHAGHLRVASTKDTWMAGDGSENYLTVLNTAGGTLEQVGQVDGLAPGERIYSARFFGDKGYIITFKQVDPLFTFDLSNPTAPTLVGELKVPGFSTYIHPLDSGHLLTIGQEVEDMGGWIGTIGMKLEIFDVTDFANPVSTHKHVFEAGYYSEALYEHKAFTYNSELGVLAIPVSGYGDVAWGSGGVAVDGSESGSGSGGGSSAGAPPPTENPDEPTDSEPTDEPTDQEPPDGEPTDPEPTDEEPWVEPDYKVGLGVFSVSATDGISEKGFVSHAPLFDSGSNWYWRHEVRRTVMIDDWMYSVGEAGMMVNRIDDLSEVAVVPFPEDYGYDYGYPDGSDPMPVATDDGPRESEESP